MSTVAFYDEHADEFYASTVGADMGALYDAFLPLLPDGARILDAGCGSGRDSRAFLERGYAVTAFDASNEMVARASALLGRPVRRLTFQAMDYAGAFEGVWACASLLHVPRAAFDDVLARLARALVPGGVAFLSFKYGDGEEERNGRWFNSYDEGSFRAVLARQELMEELRLWRTSDVRPGRLHEYWLDALLKKGNGKTDTRQERSLWRPR